MSLHVHVEGKRLHGPFEGDREAAHPEARTLPAPELLPDLWVGATLVAAEASRTGLLVVVLEERTLAGFGVGPLRTGLAHVGRADTRRGAQRRAPSLDAGRLRRVLDLIDARLGDPLTLDDLARAACLSPFHFARLFREATGSPPHRYLVERRIVAAQAMLREGRAALVEVALDAGFGSQASFTRSFRKVTGLTPGHYRELHRRGGPRTETARRVALSATRSASSRNTGAPAVP